MWPTAWPQKWKKEQLPNQIKPYFEAASLKSGPSSSKSGPLKQVEIHSSSGHFGVIFRSLNFLMFCRLIFEVTFRIIFMLDHYDILYFVLLLFLLMHRFYECNNFYQTAFDYQILWMIWIDVKYVAKSYNHIHVFWNVLLVIYHFT